MKRHALRRDLHDPGALAGQTALAQSGLQTAAILESRCGQLLIANIEGPSVLKCLGTDSLSQYIPIGRKLWLIDRKQIWLAIH
jgi:hypothetical protein